LFAITSAHPDWQISALIRSQEKAAQVASKYPHIRIVIGDLDSSDLIEKEVQDADIVFSMSTYSSL
jgi:N-acetyl-gamma-glutamylphosphate reductase